MPFTNVTNNTMAQSAFANATAGAGLGEPDGGLNKDDHALWAIAELLGPVSVLPGEVGVTNSLYPVGDVRRYGAVANGIANDVSAVNNAILSAQALGGGTVVIPAASIVRVDSTVNLRPTVSLRIDGILRAGAAMTALIQTPLTSLVEDCRITGSGFVLCNSLADAGIDLQWTRHFTVSGITIEDFLVVGLRSGNILSSGTSYGTMISQMWTHRRVASIPAGSIGVHFRTATDSHITQCVLVGASIGAQADASNNRFTDVHCWARLSTGVMQKAFYDTANGNVYMDCYADTPSVYGWHFTGTQMRLIGCDVFNNPDGSDNIISGIRFDNSGVAATIYGCRFSGAPANRILNAVDFGGGSGTASTYRGNVFSDVTTTLNESSPASQTMVGGVFVGASGTKLTQIKVYTQTLTPSAVGANSTAEQTFTVTGLATSDKVFANAAGVIGAAGIRITNTRASASNTLALAFENTTAGSLTPTSQSYTIMAIRS